MLDNAVNMLTQSVTFLGGVLVVFGLINLAMTIQAGIEGAGAQFTGALSMIDGGCSVMETALCSG